MKEKETGGNPGEVLREKLVAFQREIAGLRQQLKEQEDACLRRERELCVELFEVLDVFDSMEMNLARKQEPLDKGGLCLLGSMKAVQRKLLRLLGSRQIKPLDFSDRRARIGSCAVADTRPAPGRENGEILAVLKRGWIDAGSGAVLRKAEVVTARNEEQSPAAP